MRASVIGLGKIGSTLAAILAAKGFQVIGIDVNQGFVDAINEGRAPVQEPGLQALIDNADGRLSATRDTARAVAETDVTFVIVPTPSMASGRFTMKYVLEAAEGIGEGLAAKDGYHVVVLTSTVMPGDGEAQFRPALEARSAKVCGSDFGLCFSPEFIVLGNVIQGILNPDFVLIGESDDRAGATLAGIYQRVCENDPPIARMNIVNAELTKLSVNTFITTRISYANMLSHVCEKLPGADVDVVTGAIGLDSRIGTKYLSGALSYGGPCFPRDNIALGRLARDLGAEPLIAEATDATNRIQLEHLAGVVAGHVRSGETIGILGLSYKPDTAVIEASPSIDLARRLAGAGHAVVGYDPLAVEPARTVLGDDVAFAESVADCAGRADVLVIAVPWAEFGALRPSDLKTGATLIDCWRILPREDFQGACNYVTLGTGPPVGGAAEDRTRRRIA